MATPLPVRVVEHQAAIFRRFWRGLSNGQAVLAIGQGTFGAIFTLVGGTIAIAFAGLALAGIIVALTLWQRMRTPKPAT